MEDPIQTEQNAFNAGKLRLYEMLLMLFFSL